MTRDLPYRNSNQKSELTDNDWGEKTSDSAKDLSFSYFQGVS